MSHLAPVPGWPDDRVRVLTALEMAELVDAGQLDGVRGAIKFAALCTVDSDGARAFADDAAAGAADWRRVKACALAGMVANGLLEGEDADSPGNSGASR